MLAGRASVRVDQELLTETERDLRDALLAERKSDFPTSYRAVCDLLEAWEKNDALRDDQDHLEANQRVILIRLGFAIGSLASYSVSAAYRTYTLLGHRIALHSCHVDTMRQRPWRNLVQNDLEADGRGLGYTIIQILPSSLAVILGHISQRCGRPELWKEISGGGGSGRVFLKFNYARKVRARAKTAQSILENFQKGIDLMLLVADPDYWKLYAFAEDQVGVAIIGTGFTSNSAEDQIIHTDMGHLRAFGYTSVFATRWHRGIHDPLPVSLILCLVGKTHLTIQPKSWGCSYPTTSEALDLTPGQLIIFNGNFCHAGRAHSVTSWRMHWYRPLQSVLFDMINLNIDLC